jgi:hypothetical protein
MLEAAAAALVFIVIVWWTMFCDRPGDEPVAPTKDTPEPEKPGATLPVERVE